MEKNPIQVIDEELANLKKKIKDMEAQVFAYETVRKKLDKQEPQK